ncbi:MAG TPA: alpha/beta fold hydrolase [Gemmatimonadales bacterium]|jgi:haloalkane dehalogenase|nr:alpha/beta fold hydrolase [Gemmatimonadales bacterium]
MSTNGAAVLPPDIRELYPFESHYLQVSGGHRMHYLDEGSGPPLLMLHGNPTWSFYYRQLVQGLRDRYRCIVPDHIGCGLSDKPQQWSYRIADHAANIATLIERLDLRDATLVVHDWGGPIGYLAALRSSERFRRFVVFNSAVFLLPLPKLLTLLRLPLYGPLVVRGLNGFLRTGLATSIANPARFTRAVRAGYLFPYDSWAHRVAILRFVQEIPLEAKHPNRRLMDELDGRLSTLSSRPHLVMWGLQDRVFHRGFLEGWRQRFPAAEIHAFEDASHWVVDEVPERIVALMREFLARD